MAITTEEKPNLGVSVTDGKILDITLGGDVSSEDYGGELEAWSQQVKSAISDLKKQTGGIMYVIVDVSSLHKFDEGSVDIVKGLASWTDGTDVKTAVIGGSVLSNMALRTIIYISKRDNIKSFETREEALAWFKE